MIMIKKNIIDYKSHNILFIYISVILRAKIICKYMNTIFLS